MRLVWLNLRHFRRFQDARVNLDAPVIALVGPNEAGKSTLLEAIVAVGRSGEKLTWGKSPDKNQGLSVLQINARCRLIGIPDATHGYTISGRSPLQWAIASLRHKHHKPSGITDDPNEWEAWSDGPTTSSATCAGSSRYPSKALASSTTCRHRSRERDDGCRLPAVAGPNVVTARLRPRSAGRPSRDEASVETGERAVSGCPRAAGRL